MERLYTNNTNTNRHTFYTMVENQLEYLYENEFGDIKNILDNMSPQEYEKFLNDVWNDVMDDNTIWEAFDNSVTESVRKRLNNNI